MSPRPGSGDPGPGHWFATPRHRVAALTAGMTVFAGAGVVALADARLPAVPPRQLAWLAGLAVLFAATEGFAVHLRVRRGAHAVSLSELPMVLGLLSADPVLVVLARVVGGGAGLRLLRRQRGPKLRFNLGLLGVQAVVAAAVFQSLGGRTGTLGAAEWIGSYAAMLSAEAVGAVLVTAVIAVHDDPGEWRRLSAALRSVPLVTVTTTAALIAAAATEQSRWALALLGLVAVVLFLAYRSHVRQEQNNAEVEQLYAFTRALDGAGAIDDLVAVVLDRTRDQLRAESAEFLLPEPTGAALHRTGLTGPAELTRTRVAREGWFGPALSGLPVLLGADAGEPDRMAVPVPLGDAVGALAVTGSMADSGPFTTGRLRLLAALANHAGVSLAKAILVDRLRREAVEKERLASHDSLSGLPNRRSFHRLVSTELARGVPGAVVMLMDLDRFKEINDALGHDVGDTLLREIGARLRRVLDGRAVVARLGGDEFAVLVPAGGGEPAALALAEELAERVQAPIRVGPLTLDARASVGVAFAPGHGADPQTLLRHADVAMYAAKNARVGVRVYDPADDRNSRERLTLATDLRAAVDRRDLLVAFQPKVDPRTGAVVGAEALARWHHREHGAVPPDVFIPLAEHGGLVRALTQHVLEVSLRRRSAWARAGHDLHVAVNLSANSLLDAALPDAVARLLAQTGTPAAALTLELTESSIMTDPQRSMATLERLRGVGVRLSIDDFGTGYSSLGRLRELPVHEVKIDRSFVQRIAVDHRDRAVVRSAVQLGHALDLTVVAEGVEDRETYAYLARQGCDLVQGYLVARPLAPDVFDEWLRDRGAPLIADDRAAPPIADAA